MGYDCQLGAGDRAVLDQERSLAGEPPLHLRGRVHHLPGTDLLMRMITVLVAVFGGTSMLGVRLDLPERITHLT
ncbi:MAG: hypothetical protein GXX94_03510 [Chloroflexi bacterium]|nr:hypothetical protein [Chloroflexota bacterium]